MGVTRTLVRLALPTAAVALRLAQVDEDPEIEDAFVHNHVGNSMGFDIHKGESLLGMMRVRRGSDMGGDKGGDKGDAQGGSGSDSEWPEPWFSAHEHGHLVAHMLDNDTLFNFVNAYTGSPDQYYAGQTISLPEFNIPALKMQHAIPGWQARTIDEANRVTSFPSYLALAATWDKDLVYDVSLAVAEEFKTLGANAMMGPAINIHRATQHDEEFDSLSGEDPTLGSVLVRQWILGAQTHGIMTIPKYFGKAEQASAHDESSPAGNLSSWDIFYPPFETAVDVGAAGIMCATHEVNGLWSCRDQELIERDLKGSMGFHGMVMSDKNSAAEYYPYASSFEKGLDLALAEESKIPRSDHMLAGMRKAAQRVIAAIWHMRVEEKNSCQPPNCKEELARTAKTPEHVEVAKRAAGSSVVLLKNDEDVLPITAEKYKTVAVFGPAAFVAGNSDSKEDYYTGGSEEHVPRVGYEMPWHAIRMRGMNLGMKVTKNVEENPDICVVIGGSKSLHPQWKLDNSSLDAIGLAVSKCPKTVVLMEITGAVLTPWRNLVQSIALLFHSGEETSESWGSVLFAEHTPSGKLPISFPAEDERDFKWWNQPAPSYWSHNVDFAYPFGHGKSYATFDYINPTPKPKCVYNLCVMITVLNNSTKYSGSETVQVYFRFKADHPMVLRGFYKTAVLAPGASEHVFFPFGYRDVSLYQEVDGEGTYVPQEEIEVHIGASSRDIRHSLTMNPKGLGGR